MIKSIESNDVKSFVDEVKFRFCKDENETNNALAGVKPEDIIIWCKVVDPETFEPSVLVVIRCGDLPLRECMKFGILVEHMPKDLI